MAIETLCPETSEVRLARKVATWATTFAGTRLQRSPRRTDRTSAAVGFADGVAVPVPPPGQHLVGVEGEEVEEVELAHAELDEPLAEADLAGGGVDAQLAGAHHPGEVRLAATEHRAHPGEKLTELEGLDEVVVGAELEPLDAVGGLVAGREDDESAVAVAGEGPAELPAVHARHHQVEHHDLRLELVDDAQRGAPVGGGAHLEALVAQSHCDEVGDARLVVDDEHPGWLAH